MAFHVPFPQRQQQPPVNIGFKPLAHPRRRSNMWGLSGLLLAIGSIFTCGFFSPFALLISLIGLGRAPRKTAMAGTIISLAGMSIAASIVLGVMNEQMHRREIVQQKIDFEIFVKQEKQGKKIIASAISDLEGFRDEHDGSLPQAIDGNMLVIKYEDPWGQKLRYDQAIDLATIRSAGPDRRFETEDDLTQQIEGATNLELLLPVDR